ncbi:MAG TPA: sigma 54-interacting transcriptional regulator [Kofleriaceae bacterium]|nr:sigma 54-interacting transcriptional regulator [Kofleriaceae bacterium]
MGGETATLDARRSPPGSAYLLVIEAERSTKFALPSCGAVAIGRASECELRLDHSSVSRKHARIVVERGEVVVADSNSHNGTRVNGELVTGGRVVRTGDVIAVGDVLLVVHAELERELAPVVLEAASLRRRLDEEVARAVAFHRPLAVLAIADEGLVDGALRTIDVLGRDDHHLLAILPEADATVARQLAQRMGRTSPLARIGVATCPGDAMDADSLLLAARAAAKAARPGTFASVGDAVERIELGERSVLVCHPAMIRLHDLLRRLAASNLPVLIEGETGVGKEHAAYAVHHHSSRRGKPFVALNCAAIVKELVESQLFGCDKGAFTGATTAREGVFEAAHGGTLFLDEVGELELPVQAKLLRALQDRRITRVGETREREVDVRIVAATHRDLERDVEAGRFRQDLLFRLRGAPVHVPPLRERRCEIPVLFRALVAEAARAAGREPPVATPEVMERLLAYRWPGNIRELKNLAEYVVATVEDDRIEASDLLGELATAPAPAPPPPPARDPSAAMRRLADEITELERTRMIEALEKTGGIKRRAAALLGMPIRTFNMKFKQHGL